MEPQTDATLDQEASIAAESVSRFSHSWRAMRHRNFRLFFYGQGISVIGNWMTRTATGWLVYRLTGSAVLLGVVGFSTQIPSLLFAVFAGVWIERLDRRRVLAVTQVLGSLQSLALAVLTLLHIINIPTLIALSLFQGLITAFESPTRQAFLIELVDGKEDLANAIALTSSLVTMARLVGPAIAGIIIAGVGEGWCFFLDGVSYMGVVISLLIMHVKLPEHPKMKAPVLKQLREGWSYVSGFTPVRTIMLVFALVCLMGMPFTVLLPLFAGQVLHGGPNTFGLLSGALGFGAVTSSVRLAIRRSVRGLTAEIQNSALAFGFSLILLGLSNRVWLSVAAMVIAGYGMTQQTAATNTVIQTLTPEDKRSRVVSYYTMAYIGITPIGSLLAGLLANRISAPHTVLLCGACCVAIALWFTSQRKGFRHAIQSRYQELGI